MDVNRCTDTSPIVDAFGIILIHINTTVRQTGTNVAAVQPPSFMESVATLFPIGDPVNSAQWLAGWWVRHALFANFVPNRVETGDGWRAVFAVSGLVSGPRDFFAVV